MNASNVTRAANQWSGPSWSVFVTSIINTYSSTSFLCGLPVFPQPEECVLPWSGCKWPGMRNQLSDNATLTCVLCAPQTSFSASLVIFDHLYSLCDLLKLPGSLSSLCEVCLTRDPRVLPSPAEMPSCSPSTGEGCVKSPCFMAGSCVSNSPSDDVITHLQVALATAVTWNTKCLSHSWDGRRKISLFIEDLSFFFSIWPEIWPAVFLFFFNVKKFKQKRISFSLKKKNMLENIHPRWGIICRSNHSEKSMWV